MSCKVTYTPDLKDSTKKIKYLMNNFYINYTLK